MNDALRILMLHGASGDADVVEDRLRTSGIRFTSRRVSDGAALRHELEAFSPDLVLADYHPVREEGHVPLSMMRHTAPHVPVILLSDTRHHAEAAGFVGGGAADYVLKDRLGRLVPSVQRAVAESARRKATLRALEKERHAARMRCLLEVPALLARESGIQEILDRAAEAARDITGSAGASAFSGYCDEAGFAFSACSSAEMEAVLSDTIPAVVACLRDDLKNARFPESQPQFFFRGENAIESGIAAVPVVTSAGSFDGMIAVWKNIGTYAPDDESLLAQLASLVSLALERVRARQELLLREQEVVAARGALNALLEHLPVAAAIADVDGTITAASRPAREFNCLPGYVPSRFDDLPHLRVLAHGEPVREARIVTTGSGAQANVSCFSAPVRDDDGNLTGALLLWEEVESRAGLYPEGRITNGELCDRRQVAQEPADQLDMRGLFRMVLDILPVGVWVVDQGRNVLIANSPAATMCGGTVSHPNCHGLWSEKGKRVAKSQWPVTRALVHGETTFGRIFEIECCGSKKIIQMSSAPIQNEHAGTVAAIVVADDITERKRTEKALRESEKKFRAIFEEAKSVICMMTRDRRLEDINPAARELFGWSTEDVALVDPHSFFFNPADLDELICQMDLKGSVKDVETEMRRRDGSPLSVSISGCLTRDEGGVATGYRIIVHDMTERKELEQQLLQAQKMESVGVLAGGVAHDFNNLLTAISGYGQMVQEHLSPHENHLQMWITQILTASERAAALTGKLLAFGRKQILNPRNVLINDVISNTGKFLKRIIGEDIDFVTCLTGKKLTVHADVGQIEQVLMNLATNARDAMPKGGRLQLTTGVVTIEPGTEKLYRLEEPGRYAVISVSDTGIGMDDKTRERIFEPFFTTKEVGKGTGLGLSIIYGILSQHKGSVTVSSSPGDGTTFNLYLPVVKAKSKEEAPVQYAIPDGGSETVLVAEDEEIVRTYLRGILENVGYRVVTAENGEDAVRKFRKHQRDIALVLTDVVMPRKNGQDLYEELSLVKPGVPVIFMSGYTSDILLLNDREDESIPFICKPIVKNQLLQKVREQLDRLDEQAAVRAAGPVG